MSSLLNRSFYLIKNSGVRFYPRWNARHPKRVLNSDDLEEIENIEPKTRQNFASKYEATKINWAHKETEEENVIKYRVKHRHVKPLTIQNKPKKVQTDMFETTINENGDIIYTKMQDNDLRVGQILSDVKSKKERDKKQLILLEGKRLIKDALEAGCQLKYLIFSRKSDVEMFKSYLPKLGAKLYKMPYNEMQLWSDLTTNPGVMGVFKTPEVENYDSKNSLPITVICENIREPGNLGAILRIAAGVGCREVLLTKGCVSLWDSKVLRSSVGAHFRLKIKHNLNEGDICSVLSEDSNIFIADNKIISSESGEATEDLEKIIENVPLIPYYSVNFTESKRIVLIIGGETLGISEDSYNLAAQFNGVRLNIPLENKVESLNVGSALGVIAFEIKRQFAKKV